MEKVPERREGREEGGGGGRRKKESEAHLAVLSLSRVLPFLPLLPSSLPSASAALSIFLSHFPSPTSSEVSKAKESWGRQFGS